MSWSLFSTTVPVLSHLLENQPIWFCTATDSPTGIIFCSFIYLPHLYTNLLAMMWCTPYYVRNFANLVDFTLGPISLATLAVLNFRMNTRLSSIKSQPKKVVVVVFIVVVTIVGHKNLTLKFGQNWVNNKWYIVVVVFIVLVLLLWLIQKPSFKTWSD